VAVLPADFQVTGRRSGATEFTSAPDRPRRPGGCDHARPVPTPPKPKAFVIRSQLASALLAASVLAVAAPVARAEGPDPKFYVFLCLGQSNMEGFPGIEEQAVRRPREVGRRPGLDAAGSLRRRTHRAELSDRRSDALVRRRVQPHRRGPHRPPPRAGVRGDGPCRDSNTSQRSIRRLGAVGLARRTRCRRLYAMSAVKRLLITGEAEGEVVQWDNNA
jgi:hypothetical protein